MMSNTSIYATSLGEQLDWLNNIADAMHLTKIEVASYLFVAPLWQYREKIDRRNPDNNGTYAQLVVANQDESEYVVTCLNIISVAARPTTGKDKSDQTVYYLHIVDAELEKLTLTNTQNLIATIGCIERTETEAAIGPRAGDRAPILNCKL